MPQIAFFFGIKILMHYNNHNPPHFEAWYNDYRASIDIENISVLAGNLPPRVLSLVVEWALKHQDELRQNWIRRTIKEILNPDYALE